MDGRRSKLQILAQSMKTERTSFEPVWKDVADHTMPRRPRFSLTDTNRGERRNQKIIDTTPVIAARTLRSGMMSGITSPARQWFRLTTPDPSLAEVGEVKDWLNVVTQRMHAIFLRSNLYDVLPLVYGDLGGFSIAAMWVEEDFSGRVIQTKSLPLGSYWVSNNAQGRVDTLYREFRMTVRQLYEQFVRQPDGSMDWNNVSPGVKNLWDTGNREAWIDICHWVLPNDEYDQSRMGGKYKKYLSVYYELGRMGTQQAAYLGQSYDLFLRESGFDLFPLLCPRWEVNGEDTYGTACPGMDSIGDIKQLMLGEKRLAQAIEKVVSPPMTGPVSLKQQSATTIPGGITYVDNRSGQEGFKPSYQIDPRINELRMLNDSIRSRIKRMWFEDLFLMLVDDDRNQPPTAEEVRERKEEKLLALGPVLERLTQELLDPLVDLTFDIGMRRGAFPPPPESLHGVPLKIEFVSVMAQAQKLVGIASMERALGTVERIAAFDQTVLDKWDTDAYMDAYGEQLSLPPHIIRSDEETAALRANRAKQQQAQASAEQANQMAQAAQRLGSTPTGGDNALSALLQQGQAGNAVPTT